MTPHEAGAAMREAAAQVAENYVVPSWTYQSVLNEIAAAIRALPLPVAEAGDAALVDQLNRENDLLARENIILAKRAVAAEQRADAERAVVEAAMAWSGGNEYQRARALMEACQNLHNLRAAAPEWPK